MGLKESNKKNRTHSVKLFKKLKIRTNQSWLSDAPEAFVISWYKQDSNQTLMMTTKMVNVDPVAEKRCQSCKMIISAGTVKSSSGSTFRLKQNADCTTENAVYLISCSSCIKQYVGETKGPLYKRRNGHRDDWRHCSFER